MIKFSIGVNEVKKVVSQLEPVLKGGFDNLSRILFQVEDKVTAYASNGESYVKIIFECEIENKGDFTISGEKFVDIVKTASGDKIVFATTEDNRLSIFTNKINYRLTLIDSNSEYLLPPDINETKNFAINAQDLKNAISAVICCIDQSKAHLNCVVLHSNDGENNKLYIAATDGMRLGVAEKPASIKDKVPNLLVPKKAAEYIMSMIGEMQGELEIKYTDNMIQVSTGKVFYTSKLLDTAFPKYQSVIPVNNNKILEAKTADLKEIIKGIAKVSEVTYRIKMTLNSDKIKITCEDNSDDANAEIEATYSDKETMNIICNYRLFIEILDKITSSIVRIQISNGDTPMLIRSVDDDSVRYVFMPFVN